MRITVEKIIDAGIEIGLDSAEWEKSEPVGIDRYWSGEVAEPLRQAEARLLWSAEQLFVRFAVVQDEPLIISDEPVLDEKTLGLWNRDVCEIFIAPESSDRNRYFEFEVAPTGEWVDLEIEIVDGKRITNEHYCSGVTAAARREAGEVVSMMQIPWEAFGKRPKTGDVWLGNIFRCVGSGPTRGYLAWQPTLTPTPNFHVPEKFGEFIFG